MKTITAARHHHWTLGHQPACHERCSMPEGLAVFLFLTCRQKEKIGNHPSLRPQRLYRSGW
ncbi:MAG: hypothetical protein ABII26_04825 [Pseudomonadota bacterium]